MERTNLTIAALCAIVALIVAFGFQSASATDDLDLYDYFLNEDDTYPVENLEEFEGDIHIPPRGPQNQPLPDGTYTLLFDVDLQQGPIAVTFEGSLTILDDEDAIGCIQVQGTAANMVTMDAADGDWGGIVILTDPSNDQLEEWKGRFATGNDIQYCHILNASQGAASIVLGDGDVDDAQVWVHSCHFEDPNGNFQAFLADNRGLYAFQSNYIEGIVNTFAIRCDGALDNAAGGLDGDLLGQVISHNQITLSFHDGIFVQAGFNGTICNNIVENASDHSILVDNSAATVVCNNAIIDDGQGDNGIGILVDDAWCTVFNNIIVDLDIGVQGTNGANGNVDFCVFDGIPAGDEYDGGAAEGEGCVEDTDPQFVSRTQFDFHLYFDSPAINTGDDEILDPDGSRSDVGAFGGELADDFSLFEGDYVDYCRIDDDEWTAPVTLLRDTYHILQSIDVDEITIQPGTRMQFAQGVHFAMRSGEHAEIGALGGATVFFERIPDANPIPTWHGIWSENQLGGLEMYNCDITHVAEDDTAALTIWFASDVILQGLNVHDNQAIGGIWIWGSEVLLGGDNPVIDPGEGDVEGNEIAGNDGFGICIEDCDVGDVYVYGNYIHDNGSDDEDIMHCGIQIIGSEPIFSTSAGAGGLNYISENLVAGEYWADADPIWGSVHGVADVIAANGRTFGANQDEEWGVEIYVDAASSDMVISACDVYDEQLAGNPPVAERNGFLIVNSEPLFEVDADGNYWGVDEIVVNPPFDGWISRDNSLNDPNNQDFYNTLDNISTFNSARLAFDEGNFEEAIDLFEQFISEEPDNSRSGQSLKFIKSCLKETNGDFNAYREYCLNLVEDYTGDVVGRAARWMEIECLAAAGNLQGARAEYQDIVENAENAGEALVANLRLLHLDARENGNRINSTDSWISRRNQLLADANRQRKEERLAAKTNLPTVPTLQAAYPNPFNAATLINYSLSEAAD